MEIYSEEENKKWFGKQTRAEIAEGKYNQLTNNGALLIKTLLGVFTSLSHNELEHSSGLKGEEFEEALREVLKSSLVSKDDRGGYFIDVSYREPLAGL